MDSYPKSKVGELEVALKTGFAAVVFVCFIEPSKPMRVVWIVHFLLVASVWGSVLAHCRKKVKKEICEKLTGNRNLRRWDISWCAWEVVTFITLNSCCCSNFKIRAANIGKGI